ncbi:MAG: caspase family protein [Cyanobacteria bacterium J06554_11]
MANYWAITIGINQYRHLQPLMHAQNDALFVHRFLTENGGISADNGVLLSDLATSVGQQAVYPDKPAIAEWIQTMTQQVRPGDVLWFFFSGYGVQLEGADYLMPIDGDPDRIHETGMAVADLVDTLSALPTDDILLLLDINRSQGSFAGQTIGAQAIELAQSKQIPALLSCQPEQYSHETFGVRHGLFTAAILEALQQQCKTLSEISEYISKRLPELCEHHWRPIQNPVSLIPEAQKHTVVVPESRPATEVTAESVATLGSEVAAASGAVNRTDMSRGMDSPDRGGDERVAVGIVGGAAVSALGYEASRSATQAGDSQGDSVLAGAGGTPITADADVTDADINNTDLINNIDLTREAASSTNGTATGGSVSIDDGDYTNNSGLPGVYDNLDSEAGDREVSSSAIVPVSRTAPAATTNGAKLRNWGLLALALLTLGVLGQQAFLKMDGGGWREKVAALTARFQRDAEEPQADGGQPDELAAADAPEASQMPAEAPVAPGAETDAEANESDTGTVAGEPESDSADGSDAAATETAEAEAPEAAESAATAPDTDGAETSDAAGAETSGATGASTGTDEEQTAAKALLAQANAALAKRQYSEALITLQQVPRNQRDSDFSSVLTKARAGAAEAQQFNASVLTDARTSIQPTQASQFANAIAKARLIQPGEPYYEEAQQDIRSWSQIILDIAEGRATSGNLNGAIGAARVMPYDNSEFHQKAQDRIAFWQQRQGSREIIAEAQSIPRSGQASTYQKGIVKLREVPIEHPEYETAQRLADEWSDRIFSIAQARAAQGRRSAAIQAAILVPAGTTAYEPTQQAIRRWQSE